MKDIGNSVLLSRLMEKARSYCNRENGVITAEMIKAGR